MNAGMTILILIMNELWSTNNRIDMRIGLDWWIDGIYVDTATTEYDESLLTMKKNLRKHEK